MPTADLSQVVPPEATWVKVHYKMNGKKADAQLIARLWSSENRDADAVVIRGSSGDAFVKLNVPQKLYYQFPVTIELQLKVVAYKTPSNP